MADNTHLSQSIVLFICQPSRHTSRHRWLNALKCSTKSTAFGIREIGYSRSNWRIIIGHSLSGSWIMKSDIKQRRKKNTTTQLVKLIWRFSIPMNCILLYAFIIRNKIFNITNHGDLLSSFVNYTIYAKKTGNFNSIINHICFKNIIDKMRVLFLCKTRMSLWWPENTVEKYS